MNFTRFWILRPLQVRGMGYLVISGYGHELLEAEHVADIFSAGTDDLSFCSLQTNIGKREINHKYDISKIDENEDDGEAEIDPETGLPKKTVSRFAKYASQELLPGVFAIIFTDTTSVLCIMT